MLSSIKNPKIAAVARLRKRANRDEDRHFLVEGAQGIREALAEAPARVSTVCTADPLHELAIAAERAGVHVHHVGPEVLRRLTSTVTPQDLVGAAAYLDVALGDLVTDGCWAILHEVRDPGNAGTVLRSADASGAAGVVFSSSSVDPYNPKTVRASAGSIFHVPMVRGASTAEAVAAARAGGMRVLAMDARGSQDLYVADLSGPVAFLFGNEAHGLPGDVVALADATVRVPQRGRAESLNLAAAATVCLFEWARRRMGQGATLETIIAAAAHDIRSPLTAMKGLGYALERRWEQLDPEQRSLMLTGIVHDADRMDHILRLLVDAARIAAGGLELFPEQTDVQDVVQAIAVAQARDPDHPAVSFEGDGGPFFVDPARLRTVLLAFCESLVWWGAPGDITIIATREGTCLRIEAARAAGPALDEDGVAQLFRARRAGSGGGSKIGLFVANGVAQAQGGRSWATLADGVLRLHLELPLA
ncbi:MAG: TrmH family RNA methyltransferase [Actinomycetota bacterium]